MTSCAAQEAMWYIFAVNPLRVVVRKSISSSSSELWLTSLLPCTITLNNKFETIHETETKTFIPVSSAFSLQQERNPKMSEKKKLKPVLLWKCPKKMTKRVNGISKYGLGSLTVKSDFSIARLTYVGWLQRFGGRGPHL